MALVRVPASMRPVSQGRAELRVEGATVGEVLARLEPDLRARVLDERGKVRRYVNLFVDGEDVRSLSGLDTAVGPSAVITLVPAVAGG